MPLPQTDAPWPPPALKPALDRFDVHGAWWSGDPDELRSVYEREVTDGGFVNRPSQYAGGALGRLARMWWGRPTPDNEPDAKMHVPLAGDLCQAHADLLFGEPIELTSDHAASKQRLVELTDHGLHSRLLESAETVAALGGGYLRPVHDPRVSDHPWIVATTPDSVVPEWVDDKLLSAVFWRVVGTEQSGKVVLRHVELHEPGWIVHRLYQGTADSIGREIPLDEHDVTAQFVDDVNDAGAIETGYRRLDVVYVPRIRPQRNRKWRRSPMLRPMGRSVFDGAEKMLDGLDETYSSWMRDIRLAKGRVFAADSTLDNHGPGKGASWNPDREVYSVYPGGLKSSDALTVVQFAIRVDEHRETARDLVNNIMRRAGLNGATLGEPGEGGSAITAKEVVARERRSMLTRERGIRLWEPELAQLAGALLALDKRVNDTPVDPDALVTAQFPDSVTEDLQSLATTADLLNRAESASVETRVDLLHPDWTDGQKRQEVARILAQRGPVLDAPFPGDGDDPDDPADTDPDDPDVDDPFDELDGGDTG